MSGSTRFGFVMFARPRLWLAVCVLVASPSALAQSDAAAAEMLFQEGKQLLDRGQVAEACAKLGESYRLDAGTGALLLLAHCHEREGKLASAWAELSEAAARARKEQSVERESFARERAAVLAPRLSRLSIEVAPGALALPGLRVERDGIEVGRASFGAATPVDGGAHAVTASAPGYRPWSKKVRVGSEGDAVTVSVPKLEPASSAAAPLRPSQASAPDSPPSSGLTPVQLTGIVCGGVGVAALGVGGYLSLRALDKKTSSDDAGCSGNRCSSAAADLRRDAVSLADAATIAAASGAVLVGAGVTLFFVGRRRDTHDGSALRVQVVPQLGGGVLRGTF
jgi:hypothetical protein